MDKTLTREQQIQENEYAFPYHYLDLFPKCANWFPTERSYRKIVMELLGEPRDREALDVGCGDGRLCYELAKAGWHVTGIDYSERAIAYGRAFSDKAKFIADDITLYQPEGAFDAIAIVEVLEHILPDALPNVIVHLHRCLSEDGILVVTVPSANIRVIPKHYQHFTRERLEELLRPCFEVTAIFGHVKMGWRRSLFVLLRKMGMFLTPLADKRVAAPYFSLLRRLLRSIERCPPEKGERLIAVCRKRLAGS
jgi:SAM-dependent methyltransferase